VISLTWVSVGTALNAAGSVAARSTLGSSQRVEISQCRQKD
jgi:hypothetical protein